MGYLDHMLKEGICRKRHRYNANIQSGGSIENGFRPMLQFLRETITTFNKPIDFVDYEDCNPEFKENVEDDIIWLNS